MSQEAVQLPSGCPHDVPVPVHRLRDTTACTRPTAASRTRVSARITFVFISCPILAALGPLLFGRSGTSQRPGNPVLSWRFPDRFSLADRIDRGNRGTAPVLLPPTTRKSPTLAPVNQGIGLSWPLGYWPADCTASDAQGVPTVRLALGIRIYILNRRVKRHGATVICPTRHASPYGRCMPPGGAACAAEGGMQKRRGVCGLAHPSP